MRRDSMDFTLALTVGALAGAGLIYLLARRAPSPRRIVSHFRPTPTQRRLRQVQDAAGQARDLGSDVVDAVRDEIRSIAREAGDRIAGRVSQALGKR